MTAVIYSSSCCYKREDCAGHSLYH